MDFFEFLKDIIGKERFEKLQQKILEKFVEDGGFVACPCGNAIELIPGAIDLKQKDEKGNLLSQYFLFYR